MVKPILSLNQRTQGHATMMFSKCFYSFWHNLFFVFLLFPSLLLGQLTKDTTLAAQLIKESKTLIDQAKFPDAWESAQKALDLNLLHLDTLDVKVGDAFYQLGSVGKFTGEGYFENFGKALHIYRHHYGEHHAKVGGTLVEIGSLHAFQGFPDKGLPMLEKGLHIQEQLLGEDDPKLIATYYNIGIAYYVKKENSRALGFFKKSKQLLLRQPKVNHSGLSAIAGMISNLEKTRGNLEESIEELRQSVVHQLKVTDEFHPNISSSYQNMGSTFLALGELDSALLYVKKSQRIREKILPTDHINHHLSRSTLGRIYLAKNENEQARQIFLKEVGYQEKTFQKYKFLADSRTAENERKIAQSYQQDGDFENALHWYEKSLNTIGWQANTDHFDEVTDLVQLFYVFRYKSLLYLDWYKKSGDPNHLKEVKRISQNALLLNDAFRVRAFEQEEKEDVIKNGKEFYENLIEANQQLYGLDQNPSYLLSVFESMERAKSRNYLDFLKDSKAQSFSGVPDSLVALQFLLQEEVYGLRAERLEFLREEKTEAVLEKEVVIFQKTEKLDSLRSIFKEHHPDYYRLKYDNSIVDLKAFSDAALDGQTIALSYFIGEKNAYLLKIKKGATPQIFNLHFEGDLRATIGELRGTITSFQPRTNPDGHILLAKTAKRLYDELLAKALENEPANKLLILPDGELWYLPFELLLENEAVENQAMKDWPWLLKNYSISYANSATTLFEILSRPTKSRPVKNFGGFAPSYEPELLKGSDTLKQPALAVVVRNGEYELDRAKEEVEAIARLMKGKVWLGKDISEKTFKENAASFQLLHLAMHAFQNDQNPLTSHFLFPDTEQTDSSFSEDNQLNVYELYNMQLSADLAVLSACNTGIGKIKRGEGIQSLSSGFAFAGVPSTVMSLWKVPDQATADIMVRFYKNLKAGQRKR